MRRTTVMTATIALAGAWVVLTAGPTGAWLPEAVLAVTRVGLPTAAAATLLVLYFDWRHRLMRRVQADGGPCEAGDESGEKTATVTP